MDNLHILQSKVQKIKENKLTQDIIIPLLQTIGYSKVEFNGGVYEEGKDIIMWDQDRFGEHSVSVAQVKHFKLSGKASGNDSLQTVVNQLENCIRRPVLNSNKKSYLPTEVVLISTYPLDTTVLKTRFNEYESLKEQRIKIIDGVKLCQLLIEKRPDLAQSLLGVEVNIQGKIVPTLNNEILLKALGYNNKMSIKAIYTDINFNLGKYTPRILLQENYDPITYSYSLDMDQWQDFKTLIQHVSIEFKNDFLTKSIEQIEKSVNLASYHKWEINLNFLEANYEEEAFKLKNEKSELGVWMKLKKKEKDSTGNNAGKAIEIKEIDEKIKALKSSIDAIEKEVAFLRIRLDDTKIAKPKVLYTVGINGEALASQLVDKHNRIIKEIGEINNSTDLDIDYLNKFIKYAWQLIWTSEHIFKNPLLMNCVKSNDENRLHSQDSIPKLSIDIHRVFDTGLNFLVMGEAGAGKTTTLQMYAANLSNQNHKTPIWISLSRMVQYMVEDENTLNKTRDLAYCIIIYLNKLGIEIDRESLEKLFRSGKTVLLLDGLDEAIKPAPWLTSEIKKFGKQYKSYVQLVVSSRLSTENVSTLEFFPLTLMPFTEEQRNQFIQQWFKEVNNDLIFKRVTKHLLSNQEVAEIVRNPLLTTTLCVLAENNLPLPRTEINLYNDRIKLLTGYYDNVKNISSRITTTPHNLEVLSMKLAYYLHSANAREGDVEDLRELATKVMTNHLSKENAIVALQELIDPCNVLVPMSKSGQYGFGHLRYQEHLAAKEISSNRAIEINELLKSDWWKGTFTIFSKLNDNILWLIQDLGRQKKIVKNREILLTMIEARPFHEHDTLKEYLEKYIVAETDDL